MRIRTQIKGSGKKTKKISNVSTYSGINERLRSLLSCVEESKCQQTRNNVFKGESISRGVFMLVRRGVSLEALRRKLFVITYII